MIVWDVETLDVESTAVVLSIGAVYHDGIEPLSYQKMIDTGVFVKLDVREQVRDFRRTRSKDTMEWWSKQSIESRRASLIPREDDLDAATGIAVLKKWFSAIPDYKNEVVWARGTLDQMCTESLIRCTGMEQIVSYASWRDVRTGIELLYEKTRNGYVDVDVNQVSDYSRGNVLRHHPTHDSAEDLCMILGGTR